ncbi:MAG: hypothetical protein WDO73_04200 [Ignavibacteriota bacterium]
MPLEIILGAGLDSPYYNEKNKAGSLYNEGWALTHMLYFHAEYRAKFGQLVHSISSGKDSVAALAEVYGKTLGQVDKDLQSYLRGRYLSRLPGYRETRQGIRRHSSGGSPRFRCRLMLADLLHRPGKEAEQQAALRRLIEQDPERPRAL